MLNVFRILIVTLMFMHLGVASASPTLQQTSNYIEGMITRYGSCVLGDVDNYSNVNVASVSVFEPGLMNYRVHINSFRSRTTPSREKDYLHTLKATSLHNLAAEPVSSNQISSTPNACRSQITLQCHSLDDQCISVTRTMNNLMTGVSYRDKRGADWIAIIYLNADFKQASKIAKAIEHWVKLEGGNIINGTMNEDLF